MKNLKAINFFWVLGSVLLFIVFFFFLKETFFFHDEWTYIYQAINSPWTFIFSLHNGHFMPLFKVIYFLEYKTFGLYYVPYQFILLIFHFFNAFFLAKIVFIITKSKLLQKLSFLLFIFSSMYWEVLFASATLPTVLCLLFISLSIYSYLVYEKEKQRRYLFLSGLFSLLSSYSWGAGLFFPFTLLIVTLLKSVKKNLLPELVNFAGFGFISISVYLLLSKGSSISSFDAKKVIIFFFEAIKWIIISFYTSSPGFIKYFVLVFIALFLIILSVMKNKSYRKECFREIIKIRSWLIFFALNFVYVYILSAIFRYAIDMELAKSSRYTYIPLFFLILMNMLILSVILPFISKKIKLILIGYFIVMTISNINFFLIYYKNWMQTISGPNKIIFDKIITVNSKRQLDEITFPSTFHSFFSAENIYFIYQKTSKQTPSLSD